MLRPATFLSWFSLQCVNLPAAHGGRLLPMGVDLLTEIYVIYMETYMTIGPLATAGEAVTHTRKARKYIRMVEKFH